MREVEFVVGSGLFRSGDQIVDFAVGHDDFVVDFALAQARHEDFAANILAKTGERNAVFFQCQPQLRDDHLVILRDAFDGAIEFHVVDAQAVFLGKLHYRAVGNHAFKNLFFELRARRRGRALARQLAGGARHAFA